ncbi:uncharacterized protein LOC112568117 [Pomacea canaliculata]|uniref:uncharacterized protein LOC112568117 n=1 Tax=Pomacea canaliculata TaxID=400727 RepID=UPI000D73283B|nr:uncharacterized protein LOC112568117 [Pomacea canaliculata]
MESFPGGKAACLMLLVVWLVSANEAWTLSIENYTSPLTLQTGKPSEINFSLLNITKDEEVKVLVIRPGSTTSIIISCVLAISRDSCSTNNETCQCVKNVEADHQYKLLKTFNESDNGQWGLQIVGNTTWKVSFNITVISDTDTTKNSSALQDMTASKGLTEDVAALPEPTGMCV